MNTGYGMPSRRRLRGPLHPRNRPPPTPFDESPHSPHQAESAASSMPPPSSTPSAGKKREWNSTIGRGGLGSLPWEQMGPSSSGPSTSSAEFSFQSGMVMPQSVSTTSMASMPSMPSSSSASSFASFRQQPTPMSTSPSSFRTAADADESGYAARTIFSRGSQSAQAALRESSQARHESSPPAEDAPRKRRRGLAGTIVDTALNAALYTGAAALTAYSLWSSWGQSGDGEEQRHHPDAGPQADMGDAISSNVRPGGYGGKDARMPPGGLDEPPPPYYEDHATPARHEAAPTTPQSSSVRTRKVFVSSQRNRRRPTFQGSKAPRQSTSTPRKALPDAFRPDQSVASPSMSASGSQEFPAAQAGSAYGEEEEEEEEDDEMLSRFEAKMNALIAEGQAALNSTPVLHESDLRDIEAPSPSLGLGTHSRSSTPLLGLHASRALEGSPFTSTAHDDRHGGMAGVVRSSSQPDELASGGGGVLPEPVKRTFAGGGIRHSRSAFDFHFDAARSPADDSAARSPFVFGRSDLPVQDVASPTPSTRKPTRSDLRQAAPASPYSRIPRSTSTLHARRSTPHHPLP